VRNLGAWIRHRFDWCVLLALALGLVAAGPFLAQPGLPRQTDAELHVYRAAELGHLLRAGALYPRWAPDFYFGYGYPIFNYYAPLTYYLANLFDLMAPGMDVVGGVKAMFVLGLVLASLGAYLLGREIFDHSTVGRGSAAGVLAAASFAFSPYVVFIDPHARGDLAEHFAICLLPLPFYFLYRLMKGSGGRGAFAGSVLTLAALVLSHSLLGLVAAVLLLAYWAWMVMFGSGRDRAGWGALALVLAWAIIAFYWLPFLMERDAVRLDVIGSGSHFDFRNHFLSARELLAPSRALDLGATAPHYRYNLGLAQWLLALSAPLLLVCLVCRRLFKSGAFDRALARFRFPSLLYFILAGMGLIVLMLPISVPIWEQVPGMAYLQFPWRLLGPTGLMLSMCAASGVILLPKERWRNPVAAVSLGAILLLALPTLYPPAWSPEFGPTGRLDIIKMEKRGLLALGTTSTGDFLPVKAAQVEKLSSASTLIDSYAEPGPIDRVNRFTLPDGVTVEIVEQGALYDRFAVSATRDFLLRLYTFHFPGWRAYVDGEEVAIDLARPEGFISFEVPKGEHEVLVRFEDTPPRTVGWLISAAGLALLIIMMARQAAPASAAEAGVVASAPGRTSGAGLWLAGTLILFLALKWLALDARSGWPHHNSPPGRALAAQHELRVNFGDQIELVGYDLPQQRVRPGERLTVVLYWRALEPLEMNYQSFLHVADRQNLRRVCCQGDHLNPGGLPTTRWPVDKYVWDKFEILIPSDTPSGEYALNAGVYLLEEARRLKRYDEAGRVVGDSVVVASVEVR